MPESNIATIIILGCLGGLIPDLLRIIKGRYELELPKYLRSLNFWFGLIMLVLLGGLAAFLLEASDAKQALACGYAAPELFSRILSERAGSIRSGESTDGESEAKPLEREGTSPIVTTFNIREWWAS